MGETDEGVSKNERKYIINVRMRVLIGFNWFRLENGSCVGTFVAKAKVGPNDCHLPIKDIP